jgi:hypothetical protein
MLLFEIVVSLIIGGASGLIVRAIGIRSPGWVAAAAIVGFVGALLGVATGSLTRLSDLLAIDVGADQLQIVWPIAGAIFFVVWCIAVQVLVSAFAARRPRTATASRAPHAA